MEPKQLKDLVAADNVLIQAVYGAARKKDPKMPQNWRVTLTRKGRQLSVDYFGGGAVKDISAADVLYSLCLDARCGEYSFDEFCNELGYDSDSRAAEKVWKACKATAPKLHQFLGDDFEAYANAEH